MGATRREVIAAAPVLSVLAGAGAASEEQPSTIADLVRRLEELATQREAIIDRYAEPLGAAVITTEEPLLRAATAVDEEAGRLVRQLVVTPARSASEIRLKAKVTGWHNVFPNPALLCPADALVRSLLIDLGAQA